MLVFDSCFQIISELWDEFWLLAVLSFCHAFTGGIVILNLTVGVAVDITTRIREENLLKEQRDIYTRFVTRLYQSGLEGFRPAPKAVEKLSKGARLLKAVAEKGAKTAAHATVVAGKIAANQTEKTVGKYVEGLHRHSMRRTTTPTGLWFRSTGLHCIRE